MCLAIYKPSGIEIPRIHLQSGYETNYSDHCGCGFAWNEGGQLHVVKDIMPFEQFYDQFQTRVGRRSALIHFRLATHRPINQENCHPFTMCNGRFALIHNGIFHIPILNPKLSDTGNFCEQVMEPAILNGSYKNKRKIAMTMGWNMCALMSADGEVIIYNDDLNQWHNGIWYSNSAFRYLEWRAERESACLDREYQAYNGD